MKIENSSPSVGTEAVKLFENVLGKKFSKQYRSFLLKFNGGCPVPDCFDFFDGKPGSQVHCFFGINLGNSYGDLFGSWQTFKDRMPSNFLPIGRDPGGNLICLAVSGKEHGRIYFWDHEFETDEGMSPTMDNMILVANDFDGFCNALHAL